jgi:glycosyltransferase involved in cell wall biosynthesis
VKIAINAADLDHSRIDGTRVYIQNILKNFGLLSQEDQFLIYHKKRFNPELSFPAFGNYSAKKLPFPFCWTQTRFAWEIFRTRPDALWMPMHSLPYLRNKKTKTVVTIHDLAFKFFPQFFQGKALRRLNFFTDHAAKKADRLIAVSESTKNDLLRVYPFLQEERIKVIYHGYDKKMFNADISQEEIQKSRIKYQIPYSKYFIVLGAIQPRKNIGALIHAFEALRKDPRHEDTGLVIAGACSWMYEDVMEKIKRSENVMATGEVHSEDRPSLLAGSTVLVFPSLYEGFGLPALEAMASGTPVIAADNSSLAEIVGQAGILFNARSGDALTESLRKVLESDELRNDLRQKGFQRAKDFSWEKCAAETLEWLKN